MRLVVNLVLAVFVLAAPRADAVALAFTSSGSWFLHCQMLGGAGQYLREEPRLSSIEFKQRMENAYRDGTAPWETGQPCSEIQRRLLAGDLPTSGTALDLGCGSGVQTLLLAAHELEVVGVDLSTTAIEGAQRRASSHPAGRRARFIAGDVAEVRGIGEPVDVLVDRGCYHLARGDHLDAFLQALRRHSRSGSLLLLLAFKIGRASCRERGE